MRQQGLALGLVSGLILALALVAGASAIGPALQHIALVPAGAQSNVAAQASGLAGAAPTTTPSPTLSQAHPISSVDSISTDSGSTLAVLFIPVVLGLAGGAILYGLSIRRVDAE